MGLNAGFVFAEGLSVAEQTVKILKNENFLKEEQTEILNIIFITGFTVHTETFDFITSDKDSETIKSEFERMFRQQIYKNINGSWGSL